MQSIALSIGIGPFQSLVLQNVCFLRCDVDIIRMNNISSHIRT
jgi:hypothetical protein